MATVKKLVQETQEEKAARELAEYKLLLAEKDYRRTKTFMLACYFKMANEEDLTDMTSCFFFNHIILY